MSGIAPTPRGYRRREAWPLSQIPLFVGVLVLPIGAWSIPLARR